eukprot:5571011-Alexandrium_andersonii.AAC.1
MPLRKSRHTFWSRWPKQCKPAHGNGIQFASAYRLHATELHETLGHELGTHSSYSTPSCSGNNMKGLQLLLNAWRGLGEGSCDRLCQWEHAKGLP